ncbi:hypothetical protein SAMN06297251_10294 [Fulvimarina manganoxydans]|uniref:Uncharacterized protein n=1 Tax=Fulvimarina manganoxydans TaxID=937218 RepID=A0A1W1YZL4_9HYPH|nr:hypothetical protein [Fulvimarina manganoxydans]SMC41261.1 hypothetical protein SAMN06297251_10294 [Fulvimarina manganoxydans]
MSETPIVKELKGNGFGRLTTAADVVAFLRRRAESANRDAQQLLEEWKRFRADPTAKPKKGRSPFEWRTRLLRRAHFYLEAADAIEVRMGDGKTSKAEGLS